MDMTMTILTVIACNTGSDESWFVARTPRSATGNACTIPYEIMTSVSQRVKRVYFEE